MRKTLFFFSIAVSVFFGASVRAAEFGFAPTMLAQVREGDEFATPLRFALQGELVNAIEGALIYPPELLHLKEIRDGNSIVNFWVEKPDARAEGKISFAGMTPGGFARDGAVFTAVFEALRAGEARLSLSLSRAFLNDGKGTEIAIPVAMIRVAVLPNVGAPARLLETDADPPEPFAPFVARDPTVYDGKWFVMFSTQDKGTGVSHYEILETWRKTGGVGWRRAESPAKLRYQWGAHWIFVKAVDHAGNARVAVIPPSRQRVRAAVSGVIVAGILILIAWLWRKLRK